MNGPETTARWPGLRVLPALRGEILYGTGRDRREICGVEIEDLLPEDDDSRPRCLDNVGLSFVALDGDAHAANRFYLEDLAVGQLRPPLNLDIER